MPMKIDFVHDRLRVTTPVFADGYTYNAADAALGNGGGGFADSSEGIPCLPAQTDVNAASAAYQLAAAASAAAPGTAALVAAAVLALTKLITVSGLFQLGTEMNERIVAQGGEAVPTYSEFMFREHVAATDTYEIARDLNGDIAVTSAHYAHRFETHPNNVFHEPAPAKFAATNMMPAYTRMISRRNSMWHSATSTAPASTARPSRRK
jgi:hypothetical protein